MQSGKVSSMHASKGRNEQSLSTTHLLPTLVLFRERHVLASVDNGEVGWQKGFGHVLRKRQQGLLRVQRRVALGRSLRQVVKEDPADA
jgi:hypothetical protein